MTTRLVDALRAKYTDGRAALRAFGVDENLLDGEDKILRKHADKVIDQLLKRFGTPQKVCKMLGMDAAALAEGEDAFEVPPGTPGIAKKVETKPPEVETSRGAEGVDEEDDPDAEYEDFSSYLRERGVAEDVIKGAVDYHRRTRGRDNRKPNGRDFLPHNRVRSSEREQPSGGRFGGERRPGEMPSDTFGAIIDHGLDRNRHALDMKTIAGNRELMARISHEPEARPLAGVGRDRRRKYGLDAKVGASESQVARLRKLVPDLARIGSASEDGASIRDGTYKSRYEV